MSGVTCRHITEFIFWIYSTEFIYLLTFYSISNMKANTSQHLCRRRPWTPHFPSRWDEGRNLFKSSSPTVSEPWHPNTGSTDELQAKLGGPAISPQRCLILFQKCCSGGDVCVTQISSLRTKSIRIKSAAPGFAQLVPLVFLHPPPPPSFIYCSCFHPSKKVSFAAVLLLNSDSGRPVSV